MCISLYLYWIVLYFILFKFCHRDNKYIFFCKNWNVSWNKFLFFSNFFFSNAVQYMPCALHFFLPLPLFVIICQCPLICQCFHASLSLSLPPPPNMHTPIVVPTHLTLECTLKQFLNKCLLWAWLQTLLEILSLWEFVAHHNRLPILWLEILGKILEWF